jgi:hypothetical protein
LTAGLILGLVGTISGVFLAAYSAVYSSYGYYGVSPTVSTAMIASFITGGVGWAMVIPGGIMKGVAKGKFRSAAEKFNRGE